MARALRVRSEEEDVALESGFETSAPLNLAASRSRVADVTEVQSTPRTSPVVPVMTGTHFHALDEKGRVIIPAKLRPALTEQFWLMLDESDNVAVYNYQTGLDVLAHCENMMADHPDNEDIASAVERITGAAELVSVEGNWRVQVSELLRFHAQLDKEIVTVGVLNHAVMWSRGKWEAAQVKRLQSTDVRRAQAGMLRAAASGIRKKANEQAAQIEAEFAPEEAFVPAARAGDGRAAGRNGGSGNAASGNGRIADVDADGRPVQAAPSTGDGKRSPRVLTLSQLGR